MYLCIQKYQLWRYVSGVRIGKFQSICLMYKTVNGLTPSYSKELIPQQNRNINLRTRVPNNLINTMGHTQMFNKSFMPNTIKLWNELDIQIRQSPRFSLFRLQLLNILNIRKHNIWVWAWYKFYQLMNTSGS